MIITIERVSIVSIGTATRYAAAYFVMIDYCSMHIAHCDILAAGCHIGKHNITDRTTDNNKIPYAYGLRHGRTDFTEKHIQCMQHGSSCFNHLLMLSHGNGATGCGMVELATPALRPPDPVTLVCSDFSPFKALLVAASFKEAA